jgi:hypothetical protein
LEFTEFIVWSEWFVVHSFPVVLVVVGSFTSTLYPDAQCPNTLVAFLLDAAWGFLCKVK